MARNAIARAQIIVYAYSYILDPKIAEMISKVALLSTRRGSREAILAGLDPEGRRRL